MQYIDSTSVLKSNIKSNKLKPIRILQVVGAMNRAGAETWLMHILRNIDRDVFQMDFLVHTNESCAYYEEIRALGGRIIPCMKISQPWLYGRDFKGILRDYGPYDVVHSHVHHFSGYVLWLAKQADVPIRIAHSHLDSSSLESKAGLYRRLYLGITKALIAQNATVGLACSQDAARDLFGCDWKSDSRWQVLYCGIDLTVFENFVDESTAVRAELGIPIDTFVVGHIGRFEPQKNHKFILEILAELVNLEANVCLLLIGNGLLRSKIEKKVVQMGLIDKVVFADIRSDVPRLMLKAMDVLVLPSLYEGLPVVGLEAQAAGLPLVISDVVSAEMDKVEWLINRLKLSQPASVWAKTILTMRNLRSERAIAKSKNIIENSQFNIRYSKDALTKIYEK